MWNPKVANHHLELSKDNLESILVGDIPAIIVKNFFEEKQCQEAVRKIKEYNPSTFQDKKLLHIGPFLMEFATRKEKYFQNVSEFQTTFEKIFEKNNIVERIHMAIRSVLPEYSVATAKENGIQYSSCVIRIHEKGKSVPIHKDNIRYEGKDYELSKIDNQLSCVLHLQESEEGGDIIIYKKQWDKKHERFRNIAFGYSQDVIKSSEFCKISNIDSGDLVILNPNYYHEVTQIKGITPRISLGMFLGFYEKTKEVVSWA